jgi:hypothetical protein
LSEETSIYVIATMKLLQAVKNLIIAVCGLAKPDPDELSIRINVLREQYLETHLIKISDVNGWDVNGSNWISIQLHPDKLSICIHLI